jgi:S1-C subfamily serine protease
MKWNTRQVLTAVCLFGVCGVSVAGAQQASERERQRMQAAEERAQQAQVELQQALEFLAQAEESDEASRRLDEAIRSLQSARSRLGRDGYGIGMRADRDNMAAWTNLATSYSTASRRGAPQLGVYLNTERRPVTDSIGVLLNSVVDDGPAYEAGLRDGDIMTVANGESLARTGRGGTSPANKLIRMKDDLEESDTLHVEYRRGATTHSADIEVRYLEDNNSYAITIDNLEGQLREFAVPDITVLPRGTGNTISLSTSFGGQLALLGMLDVELIELDEELGWYFGVQEGLLIVRAPNDDLELDLRSGDVIVAVDGREPASQTQLMRILRSYEEGETMEISIMRQRESMTVDVTVPERDGNAFWRRNGRF